MMMRGAGNNLRNTDAFLAFPLALLQRLLHILTNSMSPRLVVAVAILALCASAFAAVPSWHQLRNRRPRDRARSHMPTSHARPFGDAPTHGEITNLPGYGPVKQKQYAGYIAVNETEASYMCVDSTWMQ